MSNDTAERTTTPGASLFRGLGDPTRLAIVTTLGSGEARVTDLSRRLGLAQSTVSSHLACLRECGLIEGRPEGRQMFYRVVVPELLELLAAADVVLQRTGHAPELCRRYGSPAERELR
jgi:ArsR family transcriptional regulator, cadmium/lead-responsive transcriptional repressor